MTDEIVADKFFKFVFLSLNLSNQVTTGKRQRVFEKQQMIEWLKRIFGLEDPYQELRAIAQLTEEEARSIAQVHDGLTYLMFTGISRNEEGSLIWSFRTATIGSWLIIRVDDQAGTVLSTEREGVR